LFTLALDKTNRGDMPSIIPTLAILDYWRKFTRWMGGIWFLGYQLRQKYKRL
jgi:hypothetical protein